MAGMEQELRVVVPFFQFLNREETSLRGEIWFFIFRFDEPETTASCLWNHALKNQ